jgi:hypothetical protein
MKKTKQPEKVSNVNIDKMSLYELCRWSALEEAINLIGDKCEDRGVDFESVQLNPLDIMTYVDSQTDKIYEKVSTAIKTT